MRTSQDQRFARRASRSGLWRRWGRLGLAVLTALGPALRAQYVWRAWRAGDGLAESLTRAVTVSPRGMVWARHGEIDAISVLDGYGVQRLSAPGDLSRRVYQSRGGLAWTTYPVGLLQFVGGEWRRHPLPPLERAEAANPLGSLRQTPIVPVSADRVLVLLPDQLFEYRGISRKITVLRTADALGLGRLLDLARAPDDGLWVSAERGLLHFPPPLRRLNSHSPPDRHPLPERLALANPRHLIPVKGGEVYAVAEDLTRGRRVGVRFDGTRWERRVFPGESPRFVWPSLAPGGWWALTYTRLLQSLPDGIPPLEVPFHPGQYYDVALDAGGGFWLATSEGLLHGAPAAWRSPFAPVIRGQPVRAALAASDGTLWLATAAGLARQKEPEGAWSLTPWPPGFTPRFRAGDRLYQLPTGHVAVTPENQCWLFAPEAGAFRRGPAPKNGRFRKALGQLPDGRLCVLLETPGAPAPRRRFALFDGARFSAWTNGPPPLALGEELFFLARAKSGDWWLGGSGGVARWRDGRWRRFGTPEGYADEGAICWIERPDGRIWCGGLNRVSEFDGKRWTTQHSGLDRVWDLLSASDGSVWAATGNGLHRFFQKTWSGAGTPEGLPSEVVHTVVEDGAHRIWAGTARGLSRHFPAADIDPPVTFEPSWEPVRDPESDTTLRFSFEGRDKWRFTPDRRLLYSYRVDEGEWSPFHPDNHVVLPDLPSGRHRFEVRAMDRNWNLQLQTTATSFTVVLPWTKDPRILAVVSAALAAVLASLAFAVNRHLKLRRSYAEVERQVTERTAELQRATEALVQSQKMTALGTLAAGIAHDFNNLLSIIKGSAQLIAAHPDDRKRVLNRLRRIETAVEQASAVVLAMLGFARAGEHRPTACQVAEVVEETIRLLGDRFRREVRLRRELAPRLPPVRAARDLLQQMLLNLILNAADALGEKQGEIRITARRLPLPPAAYEWSLAPAEAPAYVELAVHDAGAGIPPEVRPRLFEPFFSTKPFSRRHGTGLGLYMVYEFAREMGLGLRVESQPGRGAAFFIALPVAASRALPDDSRR